MMSGTPRTLVDVAFATEHPVLARSEFRPVSDIPRTDGRFRVVSDYQPAGDQPQAIEDLERRIKAGEKDVVLLGATGTGKSATTAWLIERVQRPTLVLEPNKTLAAQMANELRGFFPDNAVEYFVSYYDYYQPEAYVPQTDTYIEKDSSINEDVERLRHSATSNLLSRRDCVVVSSVSCIYGLGTPQSYLDRSIQLEVGGEIDRDVFLRALVDVQYTRNDIAFARGTFRVRGDTVEVIPAYEELAVRVEFFGDEIDRLHYLHPLTGETVREVSDLRIFPATHYVASPERMEKAIRGIEAELEEQLTKLEGQNKLLEAQRLRMRTQYDIEMMRQVGFCSGIENYSRHIDGREAGSAPATLLDYFPDDFMLIVDVVLLVLFVVDVAASTAAAIGLNKYLREIDELRAKLRVTSDKLTTVLGTGAMTADTILDEQKLQLALAKLEGRENADVLRAELTIRAAALREKLTSAEHDHLGTRRLLRAFPDMKSLNYADTLAATRAAMLRLRELAAAAKDAARETAANAKEKIKKA